MPGSVRVAITRMVKPGCEEAFEQAILKLFADAQGQTDTLGVLNSMVRLKIQATTSQNKPVQTLPVSR